MKSRPVRHVYFIVGIQVGRTYVSFQQNRALRRDFTRFVTIIPMDENPLPSVLSMSSFLSLIIWGVTEGRSTSV